MTTDVSMGLRYFAVGRAGQATISVNAAPSPRLLVTRSDCDDRRQRLIRNLRGRAGGDRAARTRGRRSALVPEKFL